MRIRKLIDRVKVAGKQPKPGAPARRDEADLALEQLRNLPVPRLPRPPEEIARLIAGERKRWGKVSPVELETMIILGHLVGTPVPEEFDSADEYAAAFATWLAASDARLAGEVARR